MGRKDGLNEESKKQSQSGLSPFKSSMYRSLWVAALFSYVGAAMYDVGASWLMASISSDPLFVSLITTATTLPIFLLALPSGILSDIFDKRVILLITCGYMSIISAILGILTMAGIITSTILLMLTFALGAGMTMIRTPIIPMLSGLVPRSELPAALTLSALGGNIGRVIGPTIGGFLVAAIAPWAVFFLNSVSFIVMIIVLRRLAKKPVASSNDLSENQSQTSLPQENLIRAIRVQIRYIRYSRASRVLIVRAGLFTLCSSALLSLLPYFAKYELGFDSTGFGMLLGSFGMGAVIGGIEFLPRLRPKVSVESMIIGSIALLSMVTFSVGYIQDFGILCLLMALGGAAHITILSTFYTIGAKSAPKWIGARVLAIYLLILNGGLAIGSVIWGAVANEIGIPVTLSLAAISLAATILTKKHYNSTSLDNLDFTPVSDHWPLPPQHSIEPSEYKNQALITIEYSSINSNISAEFEQITRELGCLLKSEGMAYWELFQDPTDMGHYIEIRIADTWTDHMRQHEFVTKNIQVMENKISDLIKDCPTPKVVHYVGKSSSIW